MITVSVIGEYGYEHALLGLSLSYNASVERMCEVAERLCSHDDGHNKFLESMVVYLDIRGPRHFWQEFDTYRCGVTKQSQSTMHTLTKQPLDQEDFDEPIDHVWLAILNREIENGNLLAVKNMLPEGFMQRRIVCTNYKTLRHIYWQRHDHRNPSWPRFCKQLLEQLRYPHFVTSK